MTGIEIKTQLLHLGKSQKELTEAINSKTSLSTDTTEVCRALREGQDTKHFKIREAAELVISAWHDERRKGRL